jgi:hypothetical protein
LGVLATDHCDPRGRQRRQQGDTIDARIYQGLHFRSADVQAVRLGKQVAQWVDAHAFQPVD